MFGETEIGDLADSLMEEHVGHFEVPMHGINLVEALEAVDDLLEESGGLVLGQPVLLLEVFLEIPAVAVLHDDDHALLRLEVVDIPDHILILALLEHADLSLHEFLEFGGLNHQLLGDHLDCNLAVVALIDCLVDGGPRALTQHLEEVVGFELDAFQSLVLHQYL